MSTSKLKFNEQKATQAVALLILLSDGSRGYKALQKLIYTVERESLVRWGTSLTSDTYASMDNGPILSTILDLMRGRASGIGYWSKYIKEHGGFLTLNENPGTDSLTAAEEALLKEIFEKIGHMPTKELVLATHAYEEWEDPHGSSKPIDVSEILKAGRRSPEEIEEIEEENATLAFFKSLRG